MSGGLFLSALERELGRDLSYEEAERLRENHAKYEAKLNPDLFLAAAERLSVRGGYGSDELVRSSAYRVYDDPGISRRTSTSWVFELPVKSHCNRRLGPGTIRRLS